MLDAAIKALSQMVSPPFRVVLLKTVGLALALLVLTAPLMLVLMILRLLP